MYIQVHEQFKELAVRTSLQQLVQHQVANSKVLHCQDHVGATEFGQIFFTNSIPSTHYSFTCVICILIMLKFVSPSYLNFQMQVFFKSFLFQRCGFIYNIDRVLACFFGGTLLLKLLRKCKQQVCKCCLFISKCKVYILISTILHAITGMKDGERTA